MRVMIVDDSSMMRKILRKSLAAIKEDTFDVIEASDGREALDLMMNDGLEIEVIFLDWNMPNLDGLGFLKALKAADPFQKVPVIMVTSQAQKGHVAEALRWGARDYVVKPFADETIREKLSKLRSQVECKKSGETGFLLKAMAKSASLPRQSSSPARLPEAALLAMAQSAGVHSYTAGTVILRPKTIQKELHVIVEGQVEIEPPDGSSPAGTRGPGECIGEAGFLTGHSCDCLIRAKTAVQVAKLTRSQVGEIGRVIPDLNYYLGSLVVSRPVDSAPAASGETGAALRGRLDTMPICDLVQVLNICQKSGHLKLDLEGEQASLYFEQGELVHASHPGLSGEEAFYQLLRWTHAEFSFESGVNPPEKTIQQATMVLLMEGMRRLDESKRTAAGVLDRSERP